MTLEQASKTLGNLAGGLSEPATQPSCGQAMDCCGRQSSRDVIQGIINRHYNTARNLKVLLAMLPTVMTQEQDEALWSIACDIKHP